MKEIRKLESAYGVIYGPISREVLWDKGPIDAGLNKEIDKLLYWDLAGDIKYDLMVVLKEEL